MKSFCRLWIWINDKIQGSKKPFPWLQLDLSFNFEHNASPGPGLSSPRLLGSFKYAMISLEQVSSIAIKFINECNILLDTKLFVSSDFLETNIKSFTLLDRFRWYLSWYRLFFSWISSCRFSGLSWSKRDLQVKNSFSIWYLSYSAARISVANLAIILEFFRLSFFSSKFFFLIKNTETKLSES